jgi:hypothetical protein
MTTTSVPEFPKPFLLSDFAYNSLKSLIGPEQRAAIEEAISTPEKAWELYRKSGRAGSPAPWEDLRAAFVGGMWLVFQETAERLLLSDLISERAFREQGIKVRPADGHLYSRRPDTSRRAPDEQAPAPL